MERNKHSIKYELFRFLCLIALMGCMFVLVVESLTPGKKSARKSDAVGNAIGGFINDLGGDQAKEIDATSCTIKTVGNKRVFNVGEMLALNMETLPTDSTHKSYVYYSSDENIATITKNGIVKFHDSGEVTIKAVNAQQEDIFDEITLTVSNVSVESISSSIFNLDTIDGELDYYELEKSRFYKISNIITPDNATDKKVTYTISNPSCLSINRDIIFTKEVSDELIGITIKTSNGLEDNIYVKIIAKEVIEEKVMLESISSSDITKYIDQTSAFTPSVRYNPSYTSTEFKGYTLESLDSSICIVSDNELYVAGNAGSCAIKITSTYDSNISTTINLTVKKRSNIENFDVNYSKTMYVNTTQKITLKNIKPYDVSLITPYTFKSMDEDILTVSNNGVVEAKSMGDATVKIRVTDSNGNELEKEIVISVNVKPTYSVDDFDILYKQGEKPVLYMNEEIDLTTFFGISKFYNNGEAITPENKKYYFTFDDEVAMLDGNIITLKEYGLISGYMYYVNSDESCVFKKIELYSISNYKVISNTISTSYDLNVGSYLDFEIVDDYQLQKYDIKLNGTSIKLRINSKFFRITGSDSGKSTITITPNFDEELRKVKGTLSDLSYTITFNVSDIYTTSIKANFMDNSNEKIEYNKDYILYIGKTYSYEILLDSSTTKSNIIVEDNGLIERKFETFTPIKTGDLSIKFTDEYSNLSISYTFKVRNYISIDYSKIYTITGKHEYKDGRIEIINGDSANISLAFSEDTTYKTIIYKSTDEKILKVYQDGTIEPVKEGEASIVLTVNDGYEFLEYSIKFVVHKKNIIDNMTSFMLYVRKGLGHFGAFLILAIFSTFTFALFFRGKIYFVGVALNFALGFLFAGFTEYLQTLTPQRVGCMSDILIDYSGFISSAIIITIVFTTIFAVKYFRRNKSKKEEVDTND